MFDMTLDFRLENTDSVAKPMRLKQTILGGMFSTALPVMTVYEEVRRDGGAVYVVRSDVVVSIQTEDPPEVAEGEAGTPKHYIDVTVPEKTTYLVVVKP